MLERLKLEDFRRVYNSKNYVFFESGSFNVNIIGVRSSSRVSGNWDDRFFIFYRDNGWVTISHPGTTDPGQTELMNPSFPIARRSGVAIMAPGRYPGLWRIGRHLSWPALVQTGRCRLYRDNNRDNILDLDPKTIGWYGFETGINFHPFWGPRRFYDFVYNWSAGCQVPKLHAESQEWRDLMALFTKSAQLFGPTFTYVLLDESDF